MHYTYYKFFASIIEHSFYLLYICFIATYWMRVSHHLSGTISILCQLATISCVPASRGVTTCARTITGYSTAFLNHYTQKREICIVQIPQNCQMASKSGSEDCTSQKEQVKNSVTEETDASNTKIEKKASHKLVESNDSDGKPSDPKVAKMDAKEDVDEVIPTKLEDFGYHFNKDGQLRDIKTDGPFEFNVYPEQKKNQKRYEQLGEVITNHVYELLESEGNLEKQIVPSFGKEPKLQSFVFVSKNFDKAEKLMILIHGSGVVRAGQWARRLIINDNLQSGTQLPYIKRALAEGYEVLVTNTNHNFVEDENGKKTFIENHSEPIEHATTVWETMVQKCPAKHIAIVAHSFGGVVTCDLINGEADFYKRVFAVAFTDSVHSFEMQGLDKDASKFLKQIACNWVTSDKELDTAIEYNDLLPNVVMADNCKKVSAGTTKHEETSHSAFDSVFKFIDEKYKELSDKK